MIKTDKVVYRTRTQEEYDWLMRELEEANCWWDTGEDDELPTRENVYNAYSSSTGIALYDKYISYGNIDYLRNNQALENYEFIEVSDIMGQPYKDTNRRTQMIKTDKVIYRTRTREEYDWLKEELKEAGLELPPNWYQPGEIGVRLCNGHLTYAAYIFYERSENFERFERIDVSDLMHPYKDTAGKPKLSLVPPQIIFDVAEVREYGNKKYPSGGKDNWKNVDIDDYKDALLRHTMRYIQDPKGKDEESRIEHYKHMACNIAFICEMEKENV